jgi:hypothetical protein
MLDRCALFLAFNLLFANIVSAESVNSISLADTASTNGEADSSDPIIWEPRVNGLSRFSLTLPHDGIQDAIRYEDTSSLFYTSLKNYNGLKVIGPEQGGLTLNMTPNDFLLGYAGSFTPQFSYLVGANVDDSDLGPQIHLKYRAVSRPLSLDRYNASLNEDSAGVIWSRTSLISDDEAELLRSLGVGTNGLVAGLGMRKFEFIGGNDAATDLQLKKDELTLSTQIERYFGKGFGYLGLSTNVITGKIKIQFGLRISLEEIVDLHFSKISPSENLITPSLKGLRRKALPALWRSSVTTSGK